MSTHFAATLYYSDTLERCHYSVLLVTLLDGNAFHYGLLESMCASFFSFSAVEPCSGARQANEFQVKRKSLKLESQLHQPRQ